MRLPKGTIFLSIALAICVLTMVAGAVPSGGPPSGGAGPGQQDGTGGGAPPDQGSRGMPDNSSVSGAGDAGGPGPGPFEGGNMTRMQNQTRMDLGNMSVPFNGTFPGDANMTRLQDRERLDAGNASMPFNESAAFPGNGTGPGSGRARTGTETSAQGSPIDALIAAIENFLKGFS